MKCMTNEESGAASPPRVNLSNNETEYEHSNRAGAMALARRLEKYWQDRGYTTARFWAEPIAERFDKIGSHEVYRVNCNLVDGLPPVYRDT
jgi:hypothetical protein